MFQFQRWRYTLTLTETHREPAIVFQLSRRVPSTKAFRSSISSTVSKATFDWPLLEEEKPGIVRKRRLIDATHYLKTLPALPTLELALELAEAGKRAGLCMPFWMVVVPAPEKVDLHLVVPSGRDDLTDRQIGQPGIQVVFGFYTNPVGDFLSHLRSSSKDLQEQASSCSSVSPTSPCNGNPQLQRSMHEANSLLL